MDSCAFGKESEKVAVVLKERAAQVEWETLTEANAIQAVSRATRLLRANNILYVRTTPQGEIEWEYEYELSHSGCPHSRVQFSTESVVATHWVAVGIPIEGEDRPKFVTIDEGQRFYIPQDESFLVIEGTNWLSSHAGKFHTKYEFYIPQKE